MTDRPDLDAQDMKDLKRYVGHQLRDPLTNIQFLSDLILSGMEGRVSRNVRTQVEKIQEFGSQSLAMVDEILELVFAVQNYSTKAVVDLGEICRQVCTSFENNAIAANLALTCDLPDGECLVNANSEALTYAIQLLIEILLPMSTHKTVTISLKESVRAYCLTISGDPLTAEMSRVPLITLLQAVPNNSMSLKVILARQLIMASSGKIHISGSMQASTGFTIHFASVNCY